MSGEHRFDDALRTRIEHHLATFERHDTPTQGARAAAVALTIVGDDEGRACFLLTRRSSRLRTHASQWALPGGGIDDGETPEGAAVRELHEELGLSLTPEDVLGRLDDYPTRSGFVIAPVVVWGTAAPALQPNPDEVDVAYAIPLAELERPGVPRFLDGTDPGRPIIQIPLYGRFVHAPTAALLYQFREVALHGRPTRVAHLDQPHFARC